MKRLVVMLLGIAVLGAALFVAFRQPGAGQVSAEVVALQSLDSNQGFLRADQPREWDFPLDHGAHPDYQTEWWYYTGNLDSQDGRHFGYQLTFFRQAIKPGEANRPSDLATNQIYFAHFALTDVKRQSHLATERFSRGAAGLAGASGSPFGVWVEDWRVQSLDAEGNRVRLSAREGDRAIDLELNAVKPLVLQGTEGLSQKSSAPGNASYYYSFTRLQTQGTLTSAGETLTVSGLSWMDHEFGTTSLGRDAVGWDWFSIQLDDLSEIMYFQIRQKDGSIEPLSGGTLVGADGKIQHLAVDRVRLGVTGRWTSSTSGTTYPSGWHLEIPDEKIDLTLTPYTADQEMRVSIMYWEGAVRIEGSSNGKPVRGGGFVELTGYGK